MEPVPGAHPRCKHEALEAWRTGEVLAAVAHKFREVGFPAVGRAARDLVEPRLVQLIVERDAKMICLSGGEAFLVVQPEEVVEEV